MPRNTGKTSRGARRIALLLALALLAACSDAPRSVRPVATTRSSEPAATTRSSEPAATSQPVIGDATQPSVKLGYHYKPPEDGATAATLAQQVSFMILTKKDEPFRDELRAAGYEGLILQYVLASEVSGPPTRRGADACDKEHKPFANNVADQRGDFCTLIHPHEDWFMHNSKGERLYRDEELHFYSMNPGSAGWRAFALSRLKQRMFGDESAPPLGYDGFFFDNVELNLYKDQHQLSNSDGAVREYSSDADYRAAWRGWLAEMRKGLGTTVPLWANLINGSNQADEWNEYLPYLDGGMNEAFGTGYRVLSPEEYDNDLRQAEYVLAQGKGFYANSLERPSDVDLEPLALASYLLVMQPDAPIYFRYTALDESYANWRTYPNYNVRLGAPLGPRYAIKSGWRRDFSHGYVTVDPTRRTAQIVERPPAAATSTPHR